MYTYDYKYQKYMSYASKCNKHVPNTMYLIFQSWLWSNEVILRSGGLVWVYSSSLRVGRLGKRRGDGGHGALRSL